MSGRLFSRRTSGAQLGSAAWIRPAAFDPQVVHLRLADDSIVPAPDELRAWIDQIRAGAAVKAIRTAALFPKAAERFRELGFAVADTLALLRADLGDPAVRDHLERAPTSAAAAATGAMRQHEYTAAAWIDKRAFGPEWSHDAAELEQIRYATPHCQVRARFRRGGVLRRELFAFAVSGASAEHGYLQRLSVDPQHQRHGHGRALTIDSLRWMLRRRLNDCLVNTSIDNARALALYTSVGFRQMSDHLAVLQLDV